MYNIEELRASLDFPSELVFFVWIPVNYSLKKIRYLLFEFRWTRDGKIIRSDGYPIRNPNFWIYRTRIFGFGFGYGFDFCTRNFLDLDMDMTSTDPKPDPKPEILSEPDPNPKPEKNPNIIYIYIYIL